MERSREVEGRKGWKEEKRNEFTMKGGQNEKWI